MDRNGERGAGFVLTNLDDAVTHMLTTHVDDVATPRLLSVAVRR
jgi:hypothetical protein